MDALDERWRHWLPIAKSRALLRLVVSDHLADDIAYAAVRKFASCAHELELDHHERRLLQMVDHEIAAHFRRQNARIRRDETKRARDEEALAMFVSGVPARAMDGQTLAVWQDLLDALPERQRSLVALMADGVPQSVIADRLGYANSAVVKVTVNRLRVRLREEYAKRMRGVSELAPID